MAVMLPRLLGAVVGLVFAGMTATAQAATLEVIDFESGFANNDRAGPVGTSTNTVTFSVGSNSIGPGTIDAYVVDFAFSGPVNPAIAGDFYLSDEPSGIGVALNYFMVFSDPVSNLSLNLYDFRIDGGGEAAGDTATLTVFSDLFGAAVGHSVFTIVGDEPDGNIETLAVMAPTDLVFSASLVFTYVCKPSCTGDIGYAIDNITFETVPLPAALPLFATALAGMGLLGWRRKRKASASV